MTKKWSFETGVMKLRLHWWHNVRDISNDITISVCSLHVVGSIAASIILSFVLHHANPLLGWLLSFFHEGKLALYEIGFPVIEQTTMNIAFHKEGEMQDYVVIHTTEPRDLVNECVWMHIMRINESHWCQLIETAGKIDKETKVLNQYGPTLSDWWCSHTHPPNTP